LSNVENPNTSFKHLGNIQPHAHRACAPPPGGGPPPDPGGGPAPAAFTPLTVPGRGAAGNKAAPTGAWPCLSLSLGARVAEGTVNRTPGQGCQTRRNFTRSLALGGEAAGQRGTPARRRRLWLAPLKTLPGSEGPGRRGWVGGKGKTRTPRKR
jgi:hypothetical protein